MKAIIVMQSGKTAAIGNKGELLFSIPEDMMNFKRLTTGHIVVMGRKTYESLKRKDGLPNRTNIVVSRDSNLDCGKCILQTNMDDAMAYAEELAKKEEKDIYVIGGEALYTHFYDKVDYLYLTSVFHEREIEADSFFPQVACQTSNRTIGDRFLLVSKKMYWGGEDLDRVVYEVWRKNEILCYKQSITSCFKCE